MSRPEPGTPPGRAVVFSKGWKNAQSVILYMWGELPGARFDPARVGGGADAIWAGPGSL